MMDELTLVIPAKNESESLPKVLKELEPFKIKIIVVIPADDHRTRQSIEYFDCKIIEEKKVKIDDLNSRVVENKSLVSVIKNSINT